MTTDVKVKYPTNYDTVAITISLAPSGVGLVSDTNLLAGRESTVVDNTALLDLDHIVGGKIRLGTTPTVSKRIEVWVHGPIKVASATPTYGDVLTGSDSARTITSANIKNSLFRPLWATDTDATSARDYWMPPTGIAQFFGGALPTHWGIFVVHNTVAALDTTGANHYFHYQRVQNTLV